jgi:hypothetical protein
MRSTRRTARLVGWSALACLLGVAARAEEPKPSGFRATLGGEASGTFAAEDRGFFNDVAYRRNALQLFRASLLGEVQAGSHVALLGELRTENLDRPQIYGLYLRLRPLPDKAFDVQVGRIPPVFGAFARRRYGQDNPLIGTPLAYQYLTTVRPDAVPGTTDELLGQRGRGWLTRYSIGSHEFDAGLPFVESLRWDTGVEMRVGEEPLEWSVALTRGSLGNPRLDDDNGGKQIASRLGWYPLPGLRLGGSVARGEYLDDATQALLPATGHYRQQAAGVDAEYSWSRWLVRGEAIVGDWRMPQIDATLDVMALFLEGRYRAAPGLNVAARVDRIDFGHVTGSGAPRTWDAAVTRVEVGVGYAVHRQAQVKAAYQYNWRDGGAVREQGFLVGQVLLWF